MRKFFTITGILVILASIGLNIYLLTKPAPDADIEYIETIKYDTITDTVPVVIETTRIKYKLDTLVQKDVVIVNDTVKSVVELPLEQKYYKKDSLYAAWVSGIDPNLDSIKIYQKTREITEIRTLKDPRKFSVGPAVWGGYDINSNKLGYGVGLSLQYNLWRW